jgi:ubiquinone/menaquinone biosynthesis C-methylase UbiE
MTTEFESGESYSPENLDRDEMDWDAYAEHYDLMCEFNPSYQENIATLLEFAKRWKLPSDGSVCDLGAGTGNYTLALAGAYPDLDFVHVDFDKKMNELAAEKYKRRNVRSVRIVADYAQKVSFPPNSFDLIVCVNALYAIYPQIEVLQKVHSWLKPDGKFFVIDFGRKQNSVDWAFYLFRESMKEHRAGDYFRALLEGREVWKQNRKSTKGQSSGRYWLHSTSDFGKILEQVGFELDELHKCYRDYADLAICGKRRIREHL